MSDTLLSIAESALNAAESALAVTANNTANSTNPTYASESVDETTGPVVGPIADTVASHQPAGVSVAGIANANDPILAQAVTQQSSLASYWNQVSAQQSAIQPWFNEPQTGGLQEMLTQFGSAWTALQDNPGSSAEAATVISSGQSLADTIQGLQNALASQAATITAQLGSQMQDLATTSQALANANATAPTMPEQSAGAANLQNTIAGGIAALASVASIQVIPTADGGVTINSGGVNLVQGTTSPTASAYTVTTQGSGPWYTQTVDLSIAGTAYQPTSGAIAGNLTALHQIQTAGSLLANLAQALAAGVPTGSTSSASAQLFTATASGGLAVNTAVTPSTLQSSTNSATSTAATALATIQKAETQWTSVVNTVSNAGAQANTAQTSSQSNLSALMAQQQSVQGVNLNQQAANAAQEQESYQAAAQLITIQQSLISTLLTAVQ